MFRMFDILNDATMYSSAYNGDGTYITSPDKNYGRDEILEVFKRFDVAGTHLTHVVFRPTYNKIQEWAEANNISGSSQKVLFKAYFSEAQFDVDVPSYSIYPLTKLFKNGGGKMLAPSTDGVTWNTSDGVTSWNVPGGDFTVYYSSSYEIEYEDQVDSVNIDITGLAGQWITNLTGSNYPGDNGFLLRFTSDEEETIGTSTFFSKESGTIWKPKIIWLVNDYSYVSASAGWINLDSKWHDMRVHFSNLQYNYRMGETGRFDFQIKPRHMSRFWDSGSIFSNTYYLSDDHYFEYKLVEHISNVEIVGYTTFNRMSLDENGYFFIMDTHNMEPDRFYRIEVRGVDANNNKKYFTISNNLFKIVKP